ncbi:hypothetical protein [Phenylobacterium sp.]|jgi:hypothetical protein|uniref:hypothetical protein n=1 Tax=Phenylobacterium sp. TaxID=1871053 RepID=UPI0037834AB6
MCNAYRLRFPFSLLAAFCLAACAPGSDAAFADGLDHTPYAMIDSPRECGCLARLAPVADPMSKTPCLTDIRADGACSIRIDCTHPDAEPRLRASVLSCARPDGSG